MVKNLLVIGIHREELSFGECVADRIDRQRTDVLRIAQGISRQRNPQEARFYYTTRHREIYLQLRQQVRGRYELIIDLHSGINESGRCADVYCHDEALLDCLDVKTHAVSPTHRVRLAHIVADMNSWYASPARMRNDAGHFSHAIAHTLIPEEVWDSRDFVYVGLEIYLNKGGSGTKEDWSYARNLIDLVLSCADDLPGSSNRSSFWM